MWKKKITAKLKFLFLPRYNTVYNRNTVSVFVFYLCTVMNKVNNQVNINVNASIAVMIITDSNA